MIPRVTRPLPVQVQTLTHLNAQRSAPVPMLTGVALAAENTRSSADDQAANLPAGGGATRVGRKVPSLERFAGNLPASIADRRPSLAISAPFLDSAGVLINLMQVHAFINIWQLLEWLRKTIALLDDDSPTTRNAAEDALRRLPCEWAKALVALFQHVSDGLPRTPSGSVVPEKMEQALLLRSLIEYFSGPGRCPTEFLSQLVEEFGLGSRLSPGLSLTNAGKRKKLLEFLDGLDARKWADCPEVEAAKTEARKSLRGISILSSTEDADAAAKSVTDLLEALRACDARRSGQGR